MCCQVTNPPVGCFFVIEVNVTVDELKGFFAVFLINTWHHRHASLCIILLLLCFHRFDLVLEFFRKYLYLYLSIYFRLVLGLGIIESTCTCSQSTCTCLYFLDLYLDLTKFKVLVLSKLPIYLTHP